MPQCGHTSEWPQRIEHTWLRRLLAPAAAAGSGAGVRRRCQAPAAASRTSGASGTGGGGAAAPRVRSGDGVGGRGDRMGEFRLARVPALHRVDGVTRFRLDLGFSSFVVWEMKRNFPGLYGQNDRMSP